MTRSGAGGTRIGKPRRLKRLAAGAAADPGIPCRAIVSKYAVTGGLLYEGEPGPSPDPEAELTCWLLTSSGHQPTGMVTTTPLGSP
jgi:hypothetical protein